MIVARMRSAILTLLSSLFWLILTVFITLLLVSCGGGGSRVADGGIEGTGISVGSVTDFGSIFVNGVEFETSGSLITLDGNAVSEGDLKKGMVVTVLGTFDQSTGTASSVAAEDVVKGLVQSVAADGLSLVVIGQTVEVDNSTLIDNNIPGQDIRNLIPDVDLVEVHGFVKGNGLIGGSFIERKAALAEFRVKGFVENTNAQTFTIGTLTIDYSSADTGDLPGGNPIKGQLVEVKGDNMLVGGQLIATKVEPEGLGVAGAPQAEIEGFVTSMTSTSDFVVGSQRIITTGSTIFAGGLQSEIVVGLKIEAEGTLAGGVLTCTKVSFRDSVKLESDVDVVTVDPTDPRVGTVTLMGLPSITVITNSLTEFKNANDLNDFNTGSPHVRIRGRVAAGNTVIASELELRSSPDTDVVLQGPVDAFTAPPNDSVTILGVMVDTTSIQDANFEGVDDMWIGRAAFFDPVNGVAPGDLVKVQGDWDLAGSTVNWDEIEFED